MPATIKQSYRCEECGGSGRDWREAGITDRYAVGEQQWRGYYPTNLCFACNGTGVWGVPQDIEVEEPAPEPVAPPKPQTPVIAACDRDDWEDPRDRL